MRMIVALGGNALLRRGQPMTVESQRAAIAEACIPLARVAAKHELVVTHGNGPQVGLLAAQAAAHHDATAYPLDVLDAFTEGMLGYLIEQELDNRLGGRRVVTSLVTRVEVQASDPAFGHPTKFIGPRYTPAEADIVRSRFGWTLHPDDGLLRRVVASPRPVRVVELRPIRWLLDLGAVVVCAGGGGVPTVRSTDGSTVMSGVEAVVDKDLTSAVLARDLGARFLVIATEVDGVYLDWRSPGARRIARAHPDALDTEGFAEGSMRPKVEAAIQFVRETGGTALIGSLRHLEDMLAGRGGTVISTSCMGIECAPAGEAPDDRTVPAVGSLTRSTRSPDE